MYKTLIFSKNNKIPLHKKKGFDWTMAFIR